MSTWLYLTCLDHTPPLLADDESGQHLSDLPEIREAIANRDALVKAHDLGAHLDGYFLAHSVRFLAKHRRCKLGITDEYGQTYPTTVDELTGGPVDPEKAMFAAQTHATIAIAESLRSGTIERTETVTHYEPFQIPCERCAGSGTDPEARPDAQNRPEMASGVGNAGFHADGPAGPSGGIKLRPNPVIEAAIRAQAEMSLADDEIVVRLPKTEIVPSKPDLLRMYADGAPNPRIAGWLRAIADGIERKEGLR